MKPENLNDNQKNWIEKICTFQIEEVIDKLSIAKGYDCLSRLQEIKNDKGELFRAIKNSSYSLDVMYKKEHANNLAKFIIKNYKKEILSKLKDLNTQDVEQYFTGYVKDEIAFLNKLINLNIEELSARAAYRISMIHLLGRASSLEESNPNLAAAIKEQNKAITLSRIKPKNFVDIVFVVNEKYAAYSAVTIASALTNSDLDSYYNFNFLMDPNDPITIESQKKLSELQNIRNYKINFITANHDLIPIDVIKQKFQGSKWPFLIAYRAFFSQLLPNFKNVLSLDVDLLVLRDLNYFKTINMDDYFIAAAYDVLVPHYYDKDCNTALPHFYFNSGVMWFNLENMRKNNSDKLLTKVIQESKCKCSLFEQDLSNITFADKIYYISYKWNGVWTCQSGTHNINTKFILHYQGSKPWDIKKENATGAFKEYWLYKDLISW